MEGLLQDYTIIVPITSKRSYQWIVSPGPIQNPIGVRIIRKFTNVGKITFIIFFRLQKYFDTPMVFWLDERLKFHELFFQNSLLVLVVPVF